MIGVSMEGTSGSDWLGAVAKADPPCSDRRRGSAPKFLRFALTLLAWLCGWSWRPVLAAQGRPLAFERVARGEWFAQGKADTVRAIGYRLLFSEDEWSELWRRRFVGPPPSVNFSREFIVGVFQGAKRSGGYALDILTASFHADANSLYVTLNIREPGPGEAVDLGETNPYVIAKIHVPDECVGAFGPTMHVIFYRQVGPARAPIEVVRLKHR